MKKPQWITIGVSFLLILIIYFFGRTTPARQSAAVPDSQVHAGAGKNLTDTILNLAKKEISPDQVIRLNSLENSISRGDVKDQQLKIYHQLAHFWGDTAGFFLPYAHYEAEAARLENSEKSLTFAARLFLDNLQQEQNPEFKRWGALQAKDLFERSLRINPDNDSSKIGLGATYLFGSISDAPMEGVNRVREVLQKDSNNVYAQVVLARASLMSGQYDKALPRLQAVIRLQPDNLEALLMLAEVFERTNDKVNAAKWYKASLAYIKRADMKAAIEKRIDDLRK